jgi:hypothetical protein
MWGILMGIATIDQRPAAESIADPLPGGVVTVVHRAPMCTCGWTGRRRVALFLARHDAWMHAASTGCLPGVPLVAGR